ncbi:MAG: heme lyase CcmF/NrfE family subunit [Steroidobacteraceae bacterium]
MVVELGHFALILACCLSFAQMVFGFAGPALSRPHWGALSRQAAIGQFVFVALAFATLAYAFLENDFSVLYVASNSNSELPAFYRFAAIWGAHEGSLLLWQMVLAGWTLAALAFSRALPPTLASRMLGALGFVSLGFALFILMTSNPFERMLPPAIDGNDLNPLLQDPALAIHPPMLYTGWIGFAVPFAFAIGVMLEGRLESAWVRWVRPFATAAWMLLTLGIALGSWWAYYELGWGGWWFWDPVENSSFMPWLMGTALIHSLAVAEKRGLFRSWTLLLSIAAFSLALLGGFLVRSGILVSVHAFASDPGRGTFILVFLALCIGSALGLYAWRADRFRSQQTGFAVVSRESFLLLNNVLLVVAAGLILVGTLYPLFLDALGLAKISVGPPYFDRAFLVPMLPLVLLLGLGMHASWKRAKFESLRRVLSVLFGVALVAAIAIPLAAYGSNAVLTVIGLTAGFWVALSALVEPISRLRHKQTLSPAVLGMAIAHFGLALFVIGVTTVRSFNVEKDLSLRPGQSVHVAGFDFAMESTRHVSGPNFEAEEAVIRISKNGREVSVQHPQKRVYRVQKTPMTEAGIDAGWSRDLFAAMGEPLGDGAWSMRLQYKPMVRFIWFGCLVMAIGGLTAVCDRRYRARAQATVDVGAADASRA